MAGDKSSKRKKKTSAKKKRSKPGKENVGNGENGDAKKVLSREEAQKQNPKAFVFSSRGNAKKQQMRTAEKEQRRMHVPVVERENDEPPPFIVLVHGPPGVGKTTLIKNLIKHYTKQNIGEVKGPVTLISGKHRRLTFIECPQDLHGMVDASKYADLVLLMVDGSFGFEMETFEFLNLLQVQGFPKVMGVLTHLDSFKDAKKLKNTKKALKHRFWEEIYQVQWRSGIKDLTAFNRTNGCVANVEGAKLFYMSGMRNGKYMKRDVLNLARFISVMKFRPLKWRMSHPYLLADRFEDVTAGEQIEKNANCDRDITVFGYSRGANFKPGARVHIAGVGDYTVQEMDAMPDPCPMPGAQKRRGLNEKERLLYAPMSDVGGLLYDRDAVYIDIPDWKVNFTGEKPSETPGESMVRGLQTGGHEVDRKLEQSTIQLYKGAAPLPGQGHQFDLAYQDAMQSDDEMSGASSEDDDSRNSAESEDEESSDEDEQPVTKVANMQNGSIARDQRSRRKAVFPLTNAAVAVEPPEAESNDELEDVDFGIRDSRSEPMEDSDQDSEGLGHAVRWKQQLQRNIKSVFSKKRKDLEDLVYGDHEDEDNNDSEDEEDDLFRPRQVAEAERPLQKSNALDTIDTSVLTEDLKALTVWESEDAREQLRNRFVTGDWEEGHARDAATGQDDEDSDADVFGDFEDLETGEKFGVDGDKATATAMQAIADEKKQRQSEKAAKKSVFDSEYDTGGAASVRDGKKSKEAIAEPEEESTYYDAMKQEMAGRAARTKSALDALAPHQRISMEGHRAGTYMRLRFKGLPCELVQHFSPSTPLLIGGLSNIEETKGYLQLRLKRHRWFPKVLKTRDPLTFSIGWRRFQSVPVYAIEDINGRHRMLKYTPEHMHCLANIYASLAPTGTGIVAIQSAASHQKGWRVSATGVVTALDAAPKVVKKLKLTGTPTKILKNTAFISGMFNSPLEVAKFEGASIRTVSGIRGSIKKALHPGKQDGKAGTFRASFEDKILMSDIVFLRAWVAVDLPRFYNPVTNLLSTPPKAQNRKQDSEAPSELEVARIQQAEQQGAFLPASTFQGSKPGFIFSTGPFGTGYYTGDHGLLDAVQNAELAEGDPEQGDGDAPEKEVGWTGMKTVAQLRREQGVGAPRNPDSLYRPIERAPRKFNPMRIPKSLQAELPYKSQPKLNLARKSKTLEQKRAVVLQPSERKAVTLVQQLNAIRNAKAAKRQDQQARRREAHAKKIAETEAWQAKYNKEERKKRYVAEGLAEKHKQKRRRMQ